MAEVVKHLHNKYKALFKPQYCKWKEEGREGRRDEGRKGERKEGRQGGREEGRKEGREGGREGGENYFR
jgi:hypothetical protein